MELRPVSEEFAIIGLAVGGRVSDLKPLARLSPASFSNQRARKAFDALQSLIAEDGRANMWSMEQMLIQRHGKTDAETIMQEVREAAGTRQLQGWQLERLVSYVQNAEQRRKLLKIGEALSLAAVDEQRNVSEVLDSARNTIRSCAQTSGRIIPMADALISAYTAAFEQQAPISTGIRELDAILSGGLHKGELNILGARPAVGKSSVLLQIARAAAKQQKKVLFVSLEMSAEQIGNRILSANSGVNGGILRSGKPIPESVGEALAQGLESAASDGTENLSLLVANPLTVEELAQEAQARADGDGLDLLVVDYLQLLQTRQRTSSDFERLGIVSRALKGISILLNIPVLAAAQVRRQNTNGGTLRAPGLDELRGSGDLEQDADAVWLLHRPESTEDQTMQGPAYMSRHDGLFEGAQTRRMQLLTIEVAKQRQGATGRAWVVFDPSHMTFYDPKVRDAD